ncbi:MAG: hypothetical protein JRF56_09830 [Deltaproteobacteria bacterium]|jgi:hypothetical protein|nr:hypothetical protein [Deltaproteobacteria bacterium]
MTKEFDPRKSYLAVKANEKMIAYVGFVIQLEEDGKSKEGVVKISSLHRPYGGGYLTLTFIVDKGQDEALKAQMAKLCSKITQDSLRPQLGGEFERMVKVDLDMLEETKSWYIEEINIYFRTIAEREKVLVEEMLLPALECILPCKFEPVEWWPEGRRTEPPGGSEIEGQVSLRGLFKKWFGSG